MPDVLPGLNVSRETLERLEIFEKLVLKWQPTINLVSAASLPDLWQRHILDSIQIFIHDIPTGPLWADFGSGGGFPGITNAIMLAGQNSEAKVFMVESDARKATFLRTALRECGVQGTVANDRIEQADPFNADVMTARALSSIDTLLDHAESHLSKNGVAILHKGRNFQQEIDDARQNWTFDTVLHPSITDPEARLVEVRNIVRAKP